MRRNLGLFYLAAGDIEQGAGHLLEGIRRTTSFRELNELCDADLHDLQRFSTRWPHHGAILACLETTICPAIEAQRARIEQPPTAIEELQQALSNTDITGGWMKLGAQAGLARLYAEEQRWRLAGDMYRRLLAEETRFPEAYLGLQRVAEGLCAAGDERFHANRTATALQQYKRALALKAYPRDKTVQADLYSRLGLSPDLKRADEAQRCSSPR